MGLDVRIRESGRFKGKRKLTKQGEPELRRLLFCAAHPARTHQRFADYYQKQLNKGFQRSLHELRWHANSRALLLP